MGVFKNNEGELVLGFWYHGHLVDRCGEEYDGPMRYNLRVGDMVEFSEGGSTDEGYHNQTTKFTFVEDGEGDLFLMKEVWTDGRDCDGRMETFNRYRAVELAVNPDWCDPEVLYPMWERMKLNRGEYAQRDYTAEAMGY